MTALIDYHDFYFYSFTVSIPIIKIVNKRILFDSKWNELYVNCFDNDISNYDTYVTTVRAENIF